MRLSTCPRRLQEARVGLVKQLVGAAGILFQDFWGSCDSVKMTGTSGSCPAVPQFPHRSDASLVSGENIKVVPTVPLFSFHPFPALGTASLRPPDPSLSPGHLQTCGAGALAASLCHCPHLRRCHPGTGDTVIPHVPVGLLGQPYPGKVDSGIWKGRCVRSREHSLAECRDVTGTRVLWVHGGDLPWRRSPAVIQLPSSDK